MRYRRLGKTELMVSEIGLGAEWLERHNAEECRAVIDRCGEQGINILDCWMPEPNVRSNIGAAIRGKRERWFIQGHLGSTWQNGQYVRTRDMEQVKEAFADLLERLGTDYIDLGMIHYVDREDELDSIVNGPFYAYAKELKEKGVIRHIGLSTHNPRVAKKAVELGIVEMMLFSINPAFDLLPASEDMNTYFAEEYDQALGGIDKERAELYRLCEKNDVGLTVMKGFAGGRLFDAKRSPFGVALTPVQCIHYALTRPAVASILAGYDTPEHVDEAVSYETATEAERIMPAFWPLPPATPTTASVPTAATVSRVLRASISPWSISSMIWPPCSRRSRLRSAPIMRRWNGRLLTVSAAAAARPAVPSMFPWQSGWRRPGRCLRKGNKAVSLLDTKRKLRKWELRGFFCTAMILKFHASLLYFSMIQCKSHQSLWLIGHKQRDVQYITVQLLQGIPAVNQEFWERHWTVLHETDDLRTYSCNYFCPLLTGICPKFPIYSHIFCTINIKNHHKQAERMVKHSFGVKFM